MRIEPIHPGEHLSEILEDLEISQYRLAKAMGVPAVRVNEIAHCRRGITADTALRLGRVLDMTPEFWMNLQQRYDLEVARAATDVSGVKRLVDVEPVEVTAAT
ncbi:MAG: HigA family addiction module antitoxin [Chloroflexi bacterium]|nr:HigA family addiction module antitoxin [Chloroflexota bacterium]